MYAALKEKGGEWEGNGESKAESMLETDAVHVFTKTTIQEESSPASLHPTKRKKMKAVGCSPWAGARGTVKPAQASTLPN